MSKKGKKLEGLAILKTSGNGVLDDITFGCTYKDKVSGYKGVCTGKTSYISGCSQVLLIGASDKNGNYKAEWFDAQRVELVASVKQIVLDNEKSPGSDKQAPIR